MELPKYPATVPIAMPDESPARQAVAALLVLEAVGLGLSIPLQFLVLLSLGWEGGDEAFKHRLLESMPLLGLGALVTAVLAAVAAPAAWRDRAEAVTLAAVVAALTGALGVGWAVALRGHLLDTALAMVWLTLTLPAVLALPLLLVVRRRVRPSETSPPR